MAARWNARNARRDDRAGQQHRPPAATGATSSAHKGSGRHHAAHGSKPGKGHR